MQGDVNERISALEAAVKSLIFRVEELAAAHAQTATSVQQTIDALPVKTAEKIETMPATGEQPG